MVELWMACGLFCDNLYKKQEHYFGEILDKKMHLSAKGEIVQAEWLATPSIRPDMNLELGEFIVMPNHFHGIIIIGKNKFNAFGGIHGSNKSLNSFGSQSKNLGSILRGFKSVVTIGARLIEPSYGWQTRFHDRILRDSTTFGCVSRYIINNPIKWDRDRFNL